ncbi:MAG: glutamyl-tRNA reductase [Deltaproteobacteria bacterium HGW-Deltaproteobacteria-14]|nr:MAG: glutamyl-tRNA reductase [Deltaproteobacteria bacterium HGW-Deltaproteobacteria-14]
MPLVVLGMNHKTAPVSVREAFAIPSDALEGYDRELAADPAIAEVMVVSTCNRVEVYAVPTGAIEPLRVALTRRLGTERGLDAMQLDKHSYFLTGEDALRHVMRVCASLDSLVVGEAQILGQVKDAMATAREAASLGPVLDRTLQAAFHTAKAVRTDTEIARATVSIGSVAVDLARRIFPSLAETRVLVIGAGKMGRVTARSLASAGVERVYVTNRSREKAIALANEHGWHARDYSELDDLLAQVDVVLSCTGASRPILDVSRIKPIIKRRKYRPLFLVDIAVPRDIEPAVGDLDTVYLYNVDDLEAVSRENLEKRQEEAAEAEAMVNAAVTNIASWHRTLRIKPTIAAIRHHAEALTAGEVDRALGKKQLATLDDVQREAVKATVRAVVNKLLHPSMTALRTHAESGDGEELAAAARLLFGITSEDDPS